MALENWTHFFKPEARSKGETFIKKDKVSTPRPSDTDVQVFVRDSSGAKVTLSSESIESETLTADCTCGLSKKGQHCKHIWAALLIVEEKNPDFLENKMELVKATHEPAEEKVSVVKPGLTQAQQDLRESYKLKQNEYRKAQYQKQKQRLKDKKQSTKKERFEVSKFPLEVEEALKYFSDNGFSLEDSLTEESVSTAKKQLSRVFHPDKGGTHEEILELNSYSKVLKDYITS